MRLIPNGPADKSNLMVVGDVIEAINGISISKIFSLFIYLKINFILVNSEHRKSVDLIKSAGEELELLIRRGNRTVPIVGPISS